MALRGEKEIMANEKLKGLMLVMRGINCQLTQAFARDDISLKYKKGKHKNAAFFLGTYEKKDGVSHLVPVLSGSTYNQRNKYLLFMELNDLEGSSKSGFTSTLARTFTRTLKCNVAAKKLSDNEVSKKCLVIDPGKIDKDYFLKKGREVEKLASVLKTPPSLVTENYYILVALCRPFQWNGSHIQQNDGSHADPNKDNTQRIWDKAIKNREDVAFALVENSTHNVIYRYWYPLMSEETAEYLSFFSIKEFPNPECVVPMTADLLASFKKFYASKDVKFSFIEEYDNPQVNQAIQAQSDYFRNERKVLAARSMGTATDSPKMICTKSSLFHHDEKNQEQPDNQENMQGNAEAAKPFREGP